MPQAHTIHGTGIFPYIDHRNSTIHASKKYQSHGFEATSTPTPLGTRLDDWTVEDVVRWSLTTTLSPEARGQLLTLDSWMHPSKINGWNLIPWRWISFRSCSFTNHG